MAFIMGTAGHVDHGKTSLVRALTGIDCDRLEEEKRRGITIELGFAYCDLPNGQRLGIVDVPGHEKFVKNMVSGAAGMDFVVLVVAADEGFMPQTHEHLEICSLLGMQQGIVVITKIDAVDAEMLELVKEDVHSHLQGSFLQNAPVIGVSSQTLEGLDSFKNALVTLIAGLESAKKSDVFRLPVDRVFSIKGHGSVVTGTSLSGTVQVGNEVVIYPAMHTAKVRSLQKHGEDVQQLPAGCRTAINLQGVAKENIDRGSIIAHEGTLFPSIVWYVWITCLKSSPRAIKHKTELHFHHYAKELLAKIYLFDRDALQPGDSALAEVRFATPMMGMYGDKCVLRSFSPLQTIAGGTVLFPFGKEKRSKDVELQTQLVNIAALPTISPEERVQLVSEIFGMQGVSFRQLQVATALEIKVLERHLQNLGAKGSMICFAKAERLQHGEHLYNGERLHKDEKLYTTVVIVEKLGVACLNQVQAFHEKEPLKQGIARSAFASGFGRGLHLKLVHIVVERLIKNKALQMENEVLRLPEHTIVLAEGQAGVREKLLQAHLKAGLCPPHLPELLTELKINPKEAQSLLKILQDENLLIKVTDAMYYAPSVIQVLEGKIADWFVTHDNLDLAGFKELSGGLSRKYIIALLEYFDKVKVTMRVGDKRQLRRR